MYPVILAAIISGVASFGAAWQIQSWRADANEKHHVTVHAAEERELSRMEQARSRNVIDAVNVARQRETKLRVERDGARDAVVGLRDTVARTLVDARTGHDACLVRADALGVVFNQCAAEYQAMGAIADLHAADAQTLMSAWPK